MDENKKMTHGEIVIALAQLRARWKNTTDSEERTKIEEQAHQYTCTHSEDIDGVTVHCKNARRSADSMVCDKHIWKHGGKNHTHLTVREMQEKMRGWAHEGEQQAITT